MLWFPTSTTRGQSGCRPPELSLFPSSCVRQKRHQRREAFSHSLPHVLLTNCLIVGQSHHPAAEAAARALLRLQWEPPPPCLSCALAGWDDWQQAPIPPILPPTHTIPRTLFSVPNTAMCKEGERRMKDTVIQPCRCIAVVFRHLALGPNLHCSLALQKFGSTCGQMHRALAELYLHTLLDKLNSSHVAALTFLIESFLEI